MRLAIHLLALYLKAPQVLMIIRVYALYSQSRPILISLVALLLITIVIAAVRVTLAFLSD